MRAYVLTKVQSPSKAESIHANEIRAGHQCLAKKASRTAEILDCIFSVVRLSALVCQAFVSVRLVPQLVCFFTALPCSAGTIIMDL
jgi:hypothetical protein